MKVCVCISVFFSEAAGAGTDGMNKKPNDNAPAGFGKCYLDTDVWSVGSDPTCNGPKRRFRAIGSMSKCNWTYIGVWQCT